MNTQNARRLIALVLIFVISVSFTGACMPVGNVEKLEPQDVSVLECTTLNEVEPLEEPEELNLNEQISTTQETTTEEATETTTIIVKETASSETTTSSIPKGDYAYAEQVWDYLKEMGLNDYVCAGIMGNLMAEVGGQTLALQPFAKSSNGGYYGICQWSVRYNPSIKGASLEEQLDYLKSNLDSQMDAYGNRYKGGFDYNDFIELTNYKSAALAFAKCYERCASRHYSVRQRNAEVAYNYFVK